MKYFILIPLWLILTMVCLGQEEMNSGIIYGTNHAYSLTAPNGWILDNSSGVSQGLYAVFYKKGESWRKAPTVMYTNTTSLENEQYKTFKQFIDFDIESFKKDEPSILITNGDNISIKDSLIAYVRYFAGKNYEAVAYIDAGKTAVMIIMSSRTKEGFDDSMQSFIDLVKSYFFISDKVEIEKK
jgi:hypothetical protein